MNYPLDKMLNRLRREEIILPAHLKVTIMAAVRADGFSVKRSYLLRYAVGFASLLVVGAGGTVLAAQGALPGNMLYPVKRASETAYASVQPTAQARVVVQEKIINRRFDEADLVADNDDGTNTDDDKIENQLADDAAAASDAWVAAQEQLFSSDIEVASSR